MATALPSKGGKGLFAVDKCLDFIDEEGDKQRDILVKSDQEASIKELIREIQKSRPEGKTVVEESPVKNSGSNGVVERGVQEVEGKMRAV